MANATRTKKANEVVNAETKAAKTKKRGNKNMETAVETPVVPAAEVAAEVVTETPVVETPAAATEVADAAPKSEIGSFLDEVGETVTEAKETPAAASTEEVPGEKKAPNYGGGKIGYEEAMKIRRRLKAGEKVGTIAKEYGVDSWTITAIWIGQTYKMEAADYDPTLEHPEAEAKRQHEKNVAAARKAKKDAERKAQKEAAAAATPAPTESEGAVTAEATGTVAAEVAEPVIETKLEPIAETNEAPQA